MHRKADRFGPRAAAQCGLRVNLLVRTGLRGPPPPPPPLLLGSQQTADRVRNGHRAAHHEPAD